MLLACRHGEDGVHCQRPIGCVFPMRIARVLWNDPGTGVMRHADAGYADAIACAKEKGLKLPMV